MSRQVRYRVTALVLGGLLLGAPLLTNGTASAEQVEGGGRQVVFAGGGVLGLSCRSHPSVESMTIPADSTILVVNRTGHPAELQLAGATQGTIPKDGSTEVVFRRGTTPVLLDPNCALGDEAIPLLVTATQPNPIIPGPSSNPPDSSVSAPTTPSNPPPATSGSAMPDSVGPTTGQRPATSNSAAAGSIKTHHSRPSAAATTVVATMPQGGSGSRVKNKTVSGTGAEAPAFAGMPPGDDKALVSGVPELSLPAETDMAPAAAGVTTADVAETPSEQVAAAEPVAAMQPLPESSPIGLLAVVAIVSVIGVAVGAIRSFVSQRASRTTIA
jgi:hypothetical protein